MLTILKRDRDLLEQYQQRFKYILVDEYPDTNSSQYLWLRLLAQTRKNICCVGDDDQSIYSWRGAKLANIRRSEQDFPGAKFTGLDQNNHLPQHILPTARDGLPEHGDRLANPR